MLIYNGQFLFVNQTKHAQRFANKHSQHYIGWCLPWDNINFLCPGWKLVQPLLYWIPSLFPRWLHVNFTCVKFIHKHVMSSACSSMVSLSWHIRPWPTTIVIRRPPQYRFLYTKPLSKIQLISKVSQEYIESIYIQ